MTSPRILFHLARADFLERARRYSFLVTMAATVWLGYLVLAGNVQMHVGNHRGISNSAWTGTLMAMTASLFMSLAGFYVIKNAVERDRDTGVGQILAATRMPGWLYLLGKWLSNLAVLTAILLVLAAAAVALQLLHAGEGPLDAWDLLSPLLLLSLPVMAVVAALALLFETVPGLRGGGGNIAYFFFWIFALSVPLITKWRSIDCAGIGLVQNSVAAAEQAAFGGSDGGFSFNVGPRPGASSLQFVWSGLQWGTREILDRLGWFVFAFVVALAPALWMDRFDPARMRGATFGAGKRENWTMRIAKTIARPARGGALDRLFAPLAAAAGRFRLAAMVVAELRVTLQGASWWWRLPAAGLFLAMLVAPVDVGRHVLAFAWLWPVLMWSSMSVRAERFGAGQILVSTPHPLRRHLTSLWLAGVALAILTGGSLAFRLLLAGDLRGLAGWAAGALFIPSVAVMLGIWSGSSKLFEALYIIAWYIGPARETPGFDFMGVSKTAVSSASSLYYLASVPLVLALAFIGRWKQLRR